MTKTSTGVESATIRDESVACERCGADEEATVEVHTILDGALTRTDYYCTHCTQTFPVWW